MKNKIAVLTKINSNLKIIDNIEIPKLQRNQLLIKVKYTAVCGSQLYEIAGLRDSVKYIPHSLGHEASGIVIKKHKSVKKIRINDKVFISWISSKGKDAAPPRYFFPKTKKQINCGKVATFSKYCIVPENKTHTIPKNLSLKESVLLGCAIPTGAGMVLNQAKIKKNNKILIIGLGGVGLSSLMALKLRNDIQIDVYDINTKIYSLIKKFFRNIGFLNKKKLHNLKNDSQNKYDYIFETSGNVISLEQSIYFVKNSGKVIFASHPGKNELIKIDPFELIKGKKIEGSWGGNTNFNKNIKDYSLIIKKNKKIINHLIKKNLKFDCINQGINLMKRRKLLRAIIKL